MNRTAAGVVALLVGLVLASCGDSAQPTSEDYGNLLDSPGGLILLEEEHPTGWQRAECFSCHNVLRMHTVNRTGLPDCDTLPDPPRTACVDLTEIQDIIHNQGRDSCAQCHGTNGVPQ